MSIISLFSRFPTLFSSKRSPQSIENEQNNQVSAHIQALPPDLISEILKFLPLKELGNAFRVCKKWHLQASDKNLWNAFLKKEPNVRNLDNENLKAIGFPQVRKSIAHPRELLKAAKIACKASEDGGATIVTLPAGWSYDDLEKLSKAAVAAGIPAANLLSVDSFKEMLRKTPIKEEQTVVLTNTVIEGSRNKSVVDQEKCLEDHGFEKKLPDALTVLTIAILTSIIAKGLTSVYDWQTQQTHTLCSGENLVSSTPSGVRFYCRPPSIMYSIGVGGSQKFTEPKRGWLSYFFG